MRKFVFENQGLIKRMYGYQTHYAILKDELLDALDEDIFYDPADIYLPEAQQIVNEDPHPPSRVRSSVRSNAFQEQYPENRITLDGDDDDKVEFLSEFSAIDEIYVDHNAEKIPVASDRRLNARHIDDRSRSMKVINLQYNGKRSITSSPSKSRQKNEAGLNETKVKKSKDDPDGQRKVQITQGYSQASSGQTAPRTTTNKTQLSSEKFNTPTKPSTSKRLVQAKMRMCIEVGH